MRQRPGSSHERPEHDRRANTRRVAGGSSRRAARDDAEDEGQRADRAGRPLESPDSRSRSVTTQFVITTLSPKDAAKTAEGGAAGRRGRAPALPVGGAAGAHGTWRGEQHHRRDRRRRSPSRRARAELTARTGTTASATPPPRREAAVEALGERRPARGADEVAAPMKPSAVLHRRGRERECERAPVRCRRVHFP